MPFSPRLDTSIFDGVNSLIDTANEGIFFGTWNLTIRNATIEAIFKKNEKLTYGSCVLLPPPTDSLIFSNIKEIIKLYGLTYKIIDNKKGYYSDGTIIEKGWMPAHELFVILAREPRPILKYLFETTWKNFKDFTQWKYYAPQPVKHMYYIFKLLENGILTILEPNTHAKFLITEKGVYEGSGNFTDWGMSLNAEVYSFYLFGNIPTFPRTLSCFNVDKKTIIGNYEKVFNDYFNNFLKQLEFQKLTQDCIEILNEDYDDFSDNNDIEELLARIDTSLKIIEEIRIIIWSKKGYIQNQLTDVPFAISQKHLIYSKQSLDEIKNNVDPKERKSLWNNVKNNFKVAYQNIKNVPNMIYSIKEISEIGNLQLPFENNYFENIEDNIKMKKEFLKSL